MRYWRSIRNPSPSPLRRQGPSGRRPHRAIAVENKRLCCREVFNRTLSPLDPGLRRGDDQKPKASPHGQPTLPSRHLNFLSMAPDPATDNCGRPKFSPDSGGCRMGCAIDRARLQPGTRHAVHRYITRQLGGSIHAFAVMSALNRPTPFQAYTPFARLFSRGPLTVEPHDRGTAWEAPHANSFTGPVHGEHARDTMHRAAGGQGPVARPTLAIPRIPRPTAPYIVICPDAAQPYKEWPRERWAPLIEHQLPKGFDIVVCGQPGREPILAPAHVTFKDVGVTELAALLAGAHCLVSPDSGQVHLADALGTPVVGLYAATSATTYGPYRNRAHCVDRHAEIFPAQIAYDSSRHLVGTAMLAIDVDHVVGSFPTSPSASQG
jgi:hypothetical protein